MVGNKNNHKGFDKLVGHLTKNLSFWLHSLEARSQCLFKQKWEIDPLAFLMSTEYQLPVKH